MMRVTVRVNVRNDLRLPADVSRQKLRYSPDELAGLDQLHEREKRKGWVRLDYLRTFRTR